MSHSEDQQGSHQDLANFCTRYKIDLQLSGVVLLRELPDTTRRRIQSKCTWRLVHRGGTVLAQDDPTHEVLFIIHGTVRVVQFTQAGREIAFAEVGTGGHVGEIAAIDGGRRSAYVVAESDVVIGALGQDDFLDLLRQNTDFAFSVMRSLTATIRGINKRVRDLTGLKAPDRVALEVLKLGTQATSSANATSITLRPSPTASEIANKAATTRETVARTLSQLIRQGLLKRVGPDLQIVSVAALEDYIERMSDG
ncbi:MAG: Crp/Fnr family transcriptional regulator [Alphaproteobacteria bacterium]|nr:Crp/Fnr family transcriptional regulator [Alphaproteobacteria bacterium]TAD88035.1 MAG: Crp/Fnr family transcriptional regulator [Alphaproteobacteria bacterium]